jgi:cyclophilin family peptidyl-prolyl cis-trans isomerase/vancomycin permeability regulator SanA
VEPFDALVVLGCPVASAALPPPARRRVARAAAAYAEGLSRRVVVSGGRAWDGHVEADRLAEELVAKGVPREALLLERDSRRTRENATRTARLIQPLGWRRIGLVTCDFHLARALFCFRRAGFEVEPVAALTPPLPASTRAWRFLREQCAWILDRAGPLALLLAAAPYALGCNEHQAPDVSPASSARASASTAAASGAPSTRLAALVSAEHRRASKDVTPDDLTSHDLRTRRAAARALARIADERAAELLLPTIADDDPEVLAWAAYGLGSTCAGREGPHTRALATRAASLSIRVPERAPAAARTDGLLEPLPAIADGLGRCGGVEAERTLRAWLVTPLAEPAAWALGAFASRQDHLEDETLVALLDAADRRGAPVAGALQAFTRLARLDEAVQRRLFDVARRELETTGTRRALAIRALAATGERAAATLGELARSAKAAPAERADAVRALGRLGARGQQELADTLSRLLDDPAMTSNDALWGAGFGVLRTLLGVLAPPPDRAGPALSRLANLPIEAGAVPLARRSVALRCAAASVLAGRGTQSAVLAACDPDPNGRAGRLARLAVLDRGPLKGERLKLWQALVTADDTLVRERALELLRTHAEVAGAATVLSRALASETGGEVAVAAQVLSEHPERAASGPEGHAAAPEVNRALTAAVERWTQSPALELRTSVTDAAATLGLLNVKPWLEAACKSDQPTVRSHAAKALGLLGDRGRRCEAFEPPGVAPPELGRVPSGRVRLSVETDGASLPLELFPELAPVAVTRLVELARSGFYDGISVHRVVPGFVVQLGDRDGDGYGGADRPPLRCETSPAAFETGSVGIALSGRDTGSSQFFVTLARQAHLDGAYALVGRAGPGWDRVAEGDVVKTIRVQ